MATKTSAAVRVRVQLFLVSPSLPTPNSAAELFEEAFRGKRHFVKARVDEQGCISDLRSLVQASCSKFKVRKKKDWCVASLESGVLARGSPLSEMQKLVLIHRGPHENAVNAARSLAATARTGKLLGDFSSLQSRTIDIFKATGRWPLSDAIPRVAAGDIEAAREALSIFGFCVFQNVASEAELCHLEGKFWQHIDSTGLGIERTKPETMCNKRWQNLGFLASGVLTNYHVGQSEFLWGCRRLSGVRKVWETVWAAAEGPTAKCAKAASANKTQRAISLSTSFDGCGAVRNPWLLESTKATEEWLTKGASSEGQPSHWLHVDQNANKHGAHLSTFQGLLNFYAVEEGGSSTVLVSHSVCMCVCVTGPNLSSGTPNCG